jgi:uncharacterized protein (TIGR02302 family)
VTDQPSRNPGVPEQPAGQAVLGSPLARARWAIFWERLWPALASLFTAVGLFIAVSWLGVWLWLPPVGRVIGMLILFVITAAASVPLLRLRIPSRQEGLQRLDRISGLPHRPATTVTDNMATTAGDPFSIALWRAHLDRAADAARALKAGFPSPKLAARDPYALRGLVLVLLVATFFAAGGERLQRITSAFDFRGVVTPANFRVDAWVTPPLYTGKSPLLLPGLRPGEPLPQSVSHAVPIGSILVVRASGTSGLDVATSGELHEAPGSSKPPAGTEERRYTIDGTGAAIIRGYGNNVTFSFNAIPDRPPTIALSKEPETRPQGAMQLSYKIEDDYGATEGQATFKRQETPEAAEKKTRPLYDAPEFPLVMPQARTRAANGQTVKNLAEHPFAGSDMVMTLVAKDQAGNEGRSEPLEMKLPERPFYNPLARALIEQRRMIALDALAKPRVLIGLDALTIAPERFTPDASIYLGLRALYWNLTNARSDDDLREVVNRMWAMAVLIEDGSMGDAAAQLRAAQEALRQALDRNASDEEIKRLMDQLRQALNNFMQALAQEMRRNPEMARPLPPNARMLSEQDLKNMLDKMEQSARSGDKDAARRMLEELQAMLEGLQMARPGQGADEDMQALNDLAEMIQRQRELRDRTFKEGQESRRGQRGQQGQQGQQGQSQMGQLQGDQQGLRERLNKMLEELRKRGHGRQPGDQPVQDGAGDGLDQLGRAGEAMGDAEGQIGEGNADSAVDSQGRALDAMRRGAQNLAQSMQQQRGDGQGRGPGMGRPGRLGQARAGDETDPLGRPLRGRDYGDDTSVNVPRPGEGPAARAARILEELRKRLGEAERPQLELDYIERLLKDLY